MDHSKAKSFEANARLIIKLQAWVRGNKARKDFKFLQSKKLGADKYFSLEEYMELKQIEMSPFESE